MSRDLTKHGGRVNDLVMSHYTNTADDLHTGYHVMQTNMAEELISTEYVAPKLPLAFRM